MPPPFEPELPLINALWIIGLALGIHSPPPLSAAVFNEIITSDISAALLALCK